MAKKIRTVDQLKKKYPTAILVKNWDELKAIPNESKTHFLTIEDHCGQLTCKKSRPYRSDKSYSNQVIYLDHYLSTHTFDNFAGNTKKLQKCGFNVILDNWGRGRLR